jgi:hypothetical protein
MAKYSKESLNKLLLLIDEICNEEENLWFKERIKSISSDKEQILQNTEKIKYYLGLEPELSVDYSFIPHKLLRSRLELDNLRMENIKLDIKEKDELKRLYDYIVYSFYQVENCLNYYYHIKYKNFEDLLKHLSEIEDTRFNPNPIFKDVGDIPIAIKIFSFNKTFFNKKGDYTGSQIDNLRKVRNEGLHRCSIILKEKNHENIHIYNFLKHSTYESVNLTLKKLASVIKDNI